MPALRPRRGSPGPSRKPKAGGPQRERPNPRNRTERKTETKSKRKEKQRQKQIKNKTGAKPKRKKRRLRSNPAAAPPRSPLTRAPPPPKSGRNRRQGQATPTQSRPRSTGSEPGRREKTKTALDPAADAERPKTAPSCVARKLCAAIQIAILTCAGRNCFARAAFAPLRRPIATCFERAFGVEAGARTGPSEASARRAQRPNPLGGRRRQGLGARPKVGMNFA